MTKPKYKPDISDAKVIVQEFLEAEEKYRRDLGIYGPDDMRVKMRGFRMESSINTMRWWFNTRFPK